MASLPAGIKSQTQSSRAERPIKRPRRKRPKHIRALVRTSPFRTRSERLVAVCLKQMELAFAYEPTLFVTDLPLPGKTLGFQGFRPDFYVPEWDIYFEVTEGRTPENKHAKMAKIRSVRRLYGTTVVLIGPSKLRRLTEGEVTIADFLPGQIRNETLYGLDPADELLAV